MSAIILQNTKKELKDFIITSKLSDEGYKKKQEILNQLVEETLIISFDKIGLGDIIKNVNSSRKSIHVFNTSRFNLSDFANINNNLRYFPNEELYVTKSHREIPIIINNSIIAKSNWVFPDISYINEKLKTSFTRVADIIVSNKLINIINLFLDLLEYKSVCINYLNNYTPHGVFIPDIETEEQLKNTYPEIYEYYLEFKQKSIENDKYILRSGREVKDILEDYRKYLTLNKDKEEVGN